MGIRIKDQLSRFKTHKSIDLNTEIRNSILLIFLTVIFIFYVRLTNVTDPPISKFKITHGNNAEIAKRIRNNTINPHYNSIQHYNVTILTRVDRCNRSDIDIVLLVKSSVHNFEKRQAIRETWGKEDAFAPDIISRTVFLMGLGDVSVKEEIEKHQDIVVGDFQDTYFTLTFKACMALKWAQNQCYNSKFYALTDDDIYLNVPNLLKHLRDEIDDENEYSKMFIDENADKIEQTTFYGGEVFIGAKPERDDDNWKYGVSEEEFPYDEYPLYIGGPMCVFNRPTIEKFISAAQITKHFRMDDIFFGLLALKTGIKPHSINGVTGTSLYDTDDLESVSEYISRHYVSVEEMWEMWNIQTQSEIAN